MSAQVSLKFSPEFAEPPGWAWSTLSELVAPEPSAMTDGPFGSKLKSAHYTDSGVRVIRLGNLGVAQFKHEDRSFVSAEHAESLSRHQVHENDLLIAALAEPVGRCCQVPRSILPAIVKADCIRFKPHEELTPKFIMHWMNSPAGSKNAEAHSHGVGRLRINMKNMRGLAVPIAPLPEQHRIVAEIEKQFTRLDAAVASLERVKANLKRARASVLKAAVEGRLVPTEAELARTENRDYEPASVLLERILKERKRKHEETAGKKKYKAPTTANEKEMPNAPEGWVWACLQEIGTPGRPFAYGVLVPGPNLEDGVPLVRVGDIQNGRVAVPPQKSISASVADKFKRTYLRGGEILISIVGTIGRTAIAPRALKGANVARAVAVLPMADEISAEYISLALRSPNAKARLVGASHEVARKTLNMEDVRAAAIPLPPLAEQARIVAEVERRLSVLDALTETVATNLARCARLRQSILKRAFEGKLVPQDPTDEPASELLARIQAQAPPPKAKKRAKKKTARKRSTA